MGGTLRKLEREVVRNKCYERDGNKKAFKYEWDKFHSKRKESVNSDESVVSVRKKKNTKNSKHSSNVLAKQLKAMKSLASNVKEKIQNKKETTKQKVV